MRPEILERMRQEVRDIFYEGLAAVDPETCIHQCCSIQGPILKIEGKTYHLDRFTKILVLGAGKAGASMAFALESVLGDRITAGLVIVKYGHVRPLNHITLAEAGHPVPDENGLRATKKLLDLAREADENTLILCLMSGGGSALMTLPTPGLSLQDKQETTQLLLDCGASIHEINTIRKHLSGIKGGRLAKAAAPAVLACLVLSDVVGDNLDIIASGPAVADPGTFGQCLDIIRARGLAPKLPPAVLGHLESGTRGQIPETPKKGDPAFEKVSHFLIANNSLALGAAQKKAEAMGYHTLVLPAPVEGEARDAATLHAALARQILAQGRPLNPPACILSGGETTVTLQGKGKGGRNQEFALASAIEIKGLEHVVVLSAGTDGTDGPTDAAGALADGTTAKRATRLGLVPEHFLLENNAYPFFEALSDLFKTGPTLTNVMDLHILLVR
ncbi:MAG: glycerate kinase [Desulfobacteraceae bacterium]|nr:glycerate kinase [Desulfobacteraceae bacterium]